MHDFIGTVRARIPHTWKSHSSGWLTGNCPVCTLNNQPRPDTRGRGGFYFDSASWGYHCFNCNFKTRWEPGQLLGYKTRTLLEYVGFDSEELKQINLELSRAQDELNWFKPKPVKQEYIPNWKSMPLPDGSSSEITNAAARMILNRNMDHWTDWQHSPNFMFRKRLILPFRYQNKIVGYNARYIGNPPNKSIPKYLSKKPEHFVFNLDNQTIDKKYVIVTEGEYDAITVNGVAIGNNTISKQQAIIINSLGKKVILLPDADKSGASLVDEGIENEWYVSLPEWMDEHKDANAAAQQYGRAFVVRSIIESMAKNPTKIKVLSKQYQV